MAKWAVRGGHTEKATGASDLIDELTEKGLYEINIEIVKEWYYGFFKLYCR